MEVDSEKNPYLDLSLFSEIALTEIGQHSGVFTLEPYDLNKEVMRLALMALSSRDGVYTQEADSYADTETMANIGVLVDRLLDFARRNKCVALSPGLLWTKRDCYLVHTGDSNPMISLPTEIVLRYIYGGWKACETVGILDLRHNKCYSIPTFRITDNICDKVMKDLVLS